MNECIFCNIKEEDYILENNDAFAVYDIYPESKGHALVISKEHFANYFETPDDVLDSMNKLIKEVKKILDAKYAPKGYKVTTNVNKEAGQVIFHTHIHIVPYY
jgi:diadenosine tetraphosphate (Ap4A) HIT family hydrolase